LTIRRLADDSIVLIESGRLDHHVERVGMHAALRADRSDLRATLRRVDGPSPEQIARYRAMTPAERMREAQRLYWSARRLREAYERSLHPDWSDREISDHVRRIFLRAGT
jgi:hypothetical protein